MKRVVGVLVFLALVVLGAVAWVMHEMDLEMNKSKVMEAQILEWHVDNRGIVLTVEAGGNFYRLHTNAILINISKPVEIIFYGETPVAIMQENETYAVLDWEKLRTLEKMPRVRQKVS